MSDALHIVCPHCEAVNRVPSLASEEMIMAGENSANTCRHAPQGEIGSPVSATIAIASNCRSPAWTAANTAARSAQIVSP